MHPTLTIAVRALRRAARIIVRAGIDLESMDVPIAQKGILVNEITRAAQEDLRDSIATAYPNQNILIIPHQISSPTSLEINKIEDPTHLKSEMTKSLSESGTDQTIKHATKTSEKSSYTISATSISSDRRNTHTRKEEYHNPQDASWLILPLDGFKNFSLGFPHYALSISYKQGSSVTHAAVYDPVRDELFTASKGRGAFLNDRRIRVSARTPMKDAILAVDSALPNRIKIALPSQVLDYRYTGSSVLDLVYVACNRLDGLIGIGWDPSLISSAKLIFTEAGGLLGDWNLSAFNFNNTDTSMERLIAAPPKLFELLLAWVRKMDSAE